MYVSMQDTFHQLEDIGHNLKDIKSTIGVDLDELNKSIDYSSFNQVNMRIIRKSHST
jgi:hypothetical protein